MEKDILVILDNGHGGLDKGKYTTAPAKMHTFEDGFTIYEGHFNREIVKKLAYQLKSLGIPHHVLVPGPQDTPLAERVRVANELASKWKGKAIYISVHGNGGGGTGFEVYTSKGQTKSDVVAEFYMDAMAEEFPNKAARVDLTDGDKDKEANFYVLRKTSCPAILTESFFMDTRADAELMMSYAGTCKIVNAHLKTIEKALSCGLFAPKVKPKVKPKAVVKEPVKPKIEPAKVDNTNTPKVKPKRKKKRKK